MAGHSELEVTHNGEHGHKAEDSLLRTTSWDLRISGFLIVNVETPSAALKFKMKHFVEERKSAVLARRATNLGSELRCDVYLRCENQSTTWKATGIELHLVDLFEARTSVINACERTIRDSAFRGGAGMGADPK